VALLTRYSGRIPLLHLKDKAPEIKVQYNEDVPPDAYREAGHGSLDFPAILRAASAARVEHYFVEQDRTPGDPLVSLRQSYEYLSSLKF
jgi:sugar phosphate isomerase/epimerase